MTRADVAGAIAIVLTCAGAGAAAQSRAGAAAGTIPRTVDGRPDISGVWERPYVPDMTKTFRDQRGAGELPFTPAGAERFKHYDPGAFDYTAHCLPQGMTRSMNSPFPIEIFQAPTRVAILFEAWNVFHVVPADGRTWPRELEPTWIGTSIGRWDGDTFVVETRGFNGRTNLDTVGHPHSDQLRLTQRFTRTDARHLTYEVVVEDPVTYTRPWTNVRTFTLRPDWELMEYSCTENNKDLAEGHVK
ncbi:MAG TPA: hypothetical protein VG871_16585 [Vicinamibacterales bacterium]|nr:hypothetical protein [Vicinamibacterales bacterium]